MVSQLQMQINEMNAKHNEEVNKRRKKKLLAAENETDSINQEGGVDTPSPLYSNRKVDQEIDKDYDHRFILQADEDSQ